MKSKIHQSKYIRYNMLFHWLAGTNEFSTKCLMFQVYFFFFIISCKIRCKNGFNLFFYFFVNKDKEFWVTLNYKKKIMLWILDPWSRIHLSQRTSILHCRFSVCKHTQRIYKRSKTDWAKLIYFSFIMKEREEKNYKYFAPLVTI